MRLKSLRLLPALIVSGLVLWLPVLAGCGGGGSNSTSVKGYVFTPNGGYLQQGKDVSFTYGPGIFPSSGESLSTNAIDLNLQKSVGSQVISPSAPSGTTFVPGTGYLFTLNPSPQLLGPLSGPVTIKIVLPQSIQTANAYYPLLYIYTYAYDSSTKTTNWLPLANVQLVDANSNLYTPGAPVPGGSSLPTIVSVQADVATYLGGTILNEFLPVSASSQTCLFAVFETEVPATYQNTVLAPTSVTPGTSFPFTVNLYSNGMPFNGIVRFSSTDTDAILPAETNLSNGSGTFNAILNSSGTQQIMVTAVSNSAITATSNLITVQQQN